MNLERALDRGLLWLTGVVLAIFITDYVHTKKDIAISDAAVQVQIEDLEEQIGNLKDLMIQDIINDLNSGSKGYNLWSPGGRTITH
jgi:hypothetical protein